MSVDLSVDPCDCPPGECKCFVEPPSDCVQRLARRGVVKTQFCAIHDAYTWHLNERCIPCMRNSDMQAQSIEKYIESLRNELKIALIPWVLLVIAAVLYLIVKTAMGV